MTYIPATFKCNGCGIERTETNHWFELHHDLDEGTYSLYIRPFSKHETAEHYCGTGCLLKAISEQLPVLHMETRNAQMSNL